MKIPQHIATLMSSLEKLQVSLSFSRGASSYIFEYDFHNPLPDDTCPIVGTTDGERDWNIYAPGEYEAQGEREQLLAALAQNPESVTKPLPKLGLSRRESLLLSNNGSVLEDVAGKTRNHIVGVTLLPRGEDITVVVVTRTVLARDPEHYAYALDGGVL